MSESYKYRINTLPVGRVPIGNDSKELKSPDH